MKYIVLLMIGLVTAQVSAQKNTHELQDFREVKVYNGLKVDLIKSDKNEAVVTGKNREEVELKIDRGVLKISLNLEHIWDEDDTKVELYYQDIERIEALQNATVRLQDKIKQKRFDLEVQEGAEIYGELKVESLNIKCLTGGEIEVSGKALDQEITIRAGGQYYAKNLSSENVDISISAGGVADITAKKAVKANVKAGGTVNVYGNPEEIDKTTLLGGKVVRKN